MPAPDRIRRLFSKPVIPVLWDIGPHQDLVSQASSVILQGGTIASLSQAIECFNRPPLDHVRLLVHIDLVAGLEKNEAGVEFLARLGKIDGVVSVHHHLAKSARRMGLLSIVRIFLSDSRALEQGLRIAGKSHADVVEILPATAAVKVGNDLRSCPIPRIAGGLCRTEIDVRETLAGGSLAVTSTRPKLWQLNDQHGR